MIASLLMILPGVVQDPAQEVGRLQAEGRYLEALEACSTASEPAQAADLETWLRWSAGDLGGALRTGLAAVELPAAPGVRRSLLWHCSSLALELGEAKLALDLIDRWEQEIQQAPDLNSEERLESVQGWITPVRSQALELARRLQDAEGSLVLARGCVSVCLLLALCAALGLLRSRPAAQH